MPDMLVKLYDLPNVEPILAEVKASGIGIRRAMGLEKHLVCDWVRDNFDNPKWVSECDVAFSNKPIACYIAVEKENLIGFAVYDASSKGFFGPTGVLQQGRGQGIGKALLLAALEDMVHQGYGYAIIGAAGPVEFYQKTVGATIIEQSSPGVYRGSLNY